ncbi:Dot/Icm type IV secretion system effector Lgt3/LegC5 [Legionella pneumophila serogroup 1]|uniref:Dot/Icm type IV secretion system effector Lgt3/LegC5 n=1 Tax=Legionella pneumophila TaxID=446 RepID=UPI001A1EF1C6|nr:Dot/Icm type IV secretion system effector Lgt3/LegC5 [Legionella pneumophila]MCO1451514.1 Dot/Icm type IV secretion system effector Lgt3/LegC5 [Legionella pneumophila]MDI0457373.1 Dot/Icm type IV secretion system effector Lgt3/LegC5 [Legionella pneumophila]MDI0460259.1 Dot/Icm type IV secretion system effector Lgt3/LegC5 [Legionella pneumophila]MDI2024097.1 Dot/Icm type IV secretion system effector Lgt3/LegC5 [Legionella pneumophila]MDI2081607.1 Dot/Icm type IV secretion system effector Lgt
MKEQQKAIFIENIKSTCAVDEQMAKELADSLLEIHQLNTGVNEQTLINEVFLTKFALYLKIGKEVALDWVRKNKDLDTPFPSDAVENQPAKDAKKPVENKAQVYGAMTVGRSPVNKALNQLTNDLLKEVVERGKTQKAQKLRAYIFDQLARRLEASLSQEQINDLYNRIRGTGDYTKSESFSEEQLKILKEKVVPELKRELSDLSNGNVNILGLDVSREDKYAFDTTNIFSVWFSNNPAVYMPQHVKTQVEKTAKLNQPGKTRIVFSSLCLNETAQIDFQQWAKENNIELVDIDSIDLKSVSETDAQLLNLAKDELEAMRKGKGGNPAAASDLVRWVDVIIGESSTYIDIDLPMNDKKVTVEVHSGFPVLLNMGSALTKDGQQPAMENPAFNTDMIAYSKDKEARRQIIEGVAKKIIARYENCAKYIEESKNEELVRLKNSPGYKLFIEKTDGKFDLCALRAAVSEAHQDALSFATFFGAEYFAKTFATQELIPVIKEAIQHQNQDLLTSVIENHIEKQHLNDYPKTPDGIKKLLKSFQGIVYKPLVMEFSGPSAVSSSWVEAISGRSIPRNFEYLAEPMSQPLRVLQHHACVSGKANFSSDNIPKWCELQSDVEKRQQQREDGLSWLPDAQEKLKREGQQAKLEEEQRIKLEEEQRIKLEEEQRIKLEEEQRIKLEEEQRIKLEEEQRIKLEEEQQIKLEEEQQIKLEEEHKSKKYFAQSDAIDLILNNFENEINSIGAYYAPAKQRAIELLDTLRKYKEDAFNDPSREKLISFAQNTKRAIQEATPILQKDLGWGDYLTNLAKQLVNAVTFAVAYAVTFGTTGHQGFFALKSSLAVNQSQSLDEALNNKLGQNNC